MGWLSGNPRPVPPAPVGCQQECLQWLNENATKNRPCLTIDDVVRDFTYGLPLLVLTDCRTGLSAKFNDFVLSRVPVKLAKSQVFPIIRKI
jgi:hypothetical protein